MRISSATCIKSGCNNYVKSGFRFCYQSNCGMTKEEYDKSLQEDE